MNTEIIALIDASASMTPMRETTVAGFNKFVTEQHQVPGDARLSLTTFNNNVTPVYSGVPLASLPLLREADYRPWGNTALYDALGDTINREGDRIARARWAKKVIVVLITDGEENASRRFTLADVRRITRHTEEYGWEWVYLAANLRDVGESARQMGMPVRYARAWTQTASGMQAMYGETTSMVTDLRAGVRP